MRENLSLITNSSSVMFSLDRKLSVLFGVIILLIDGFSKVLMVRQFSKVGISNVVAVIVVRSYVVSRTRAVLSKLRTG